MFISEYKRVDIFPNFKKHNRGFAIGIGPCVCFAIFDNRGDLPYRAVSSMIPVSFISIDGMVFSSVEDFSVLDDFLRLIYLRSSVIYKTLTFPFTLTEDPTSACVEGIHAVS